ncbi:MAG TPA: DUF423 domain-containing protein [Candidatus Babeliales bacterium]|nr:DUF423 domain-containing protein [Candidatus Babeliales bacterium]
MNKILLLGAFLGLLSVLVAAYVDHSLSLTLAGKARHSISVAVRNHQLYAIVIAIIGLIIPLQANRRMKLWLVRSAYVFIAGILLFSFSIYFASITGVLGLLHFTPIGGVILMLGWASLLRTAFLSMK